MPSIPIFVDSKAPITINAQIAEQVKLLIALRELQPGEVLPTVVELAKHLEVNHNTVAAVYNDLIESDYLVAQRGKGTFVADTQTVQQLISNQPFYEHLAQVITAAAIVGLSPSELAGAAYAQAVRLSQHQAAPITLVLVGSLEHQESVVKMIQSEIGVTISFLHWQDLTASEPTALQKLRAAELIMTTGQYFWEVTQFTKAEQEVITLDFKPELPLLTKISFFPRHASLLLVASEQADSEVMKKMLKQAGISHLNLRAIDLESLSQKLHLLEQADGICASPLVTDKVRQQCQQAEKVMVFNFCIEPTNLSVLKARLVALSSERSGKKELGLKT